MQDQIHYVLECESLFTAGSAEHLMRPHNSVHLPPGVPHSFANTGTAGLVFHVVTTPADDGPQPKGGKRT